MFLYSRYVTNKLSDFALRTKLFFGVGLVRNCTDDPSDLRTGTPLQWCLVRKRRINVFLINAG